METGALWSKHIDHLREQTTLSVLSGSPEASEETSSFPYNVGELSHAN